MTLTSKTFLALLVLLFSATRSGAQQARIFSTVATLRTEVNGYLDPLPVIALGSDEDFEVSFDEFSHNYHRFLYRLEHLDRQWKPSADLFYSEYAEATQTDIPIEDYTESQNVTTLYTHYSFRFPNADIRPLVSGNYRITILLDDDDEPLPVAEVYFGVTENAVAVKGSVTTDTETDYNDRHQQLSIKVDTRNYRVQNMYNDLKLRITQNQRPDTEVALSAPMMVNGNVAVFDHMKQLVFTAGNEYRRIETVATNYLTMGVEAVEYFHPLYHVTLRTDLPRADEPYLYDQTQHGRYFIRNAEADNSATCADYMVTHFILNTAGPVQGGKIYINGEFTYNLFSPTTLMKYDAATGGYTCDLLLKQGAYNYQYLFVPDGSATGLTARIEGDKYQTVNEYLVRVYHRRQGERYDRFIGYGIAFSGR